MKPWIGRNGCIKGAGAMMQGRQVLSGVTTASCASNGRWITSQTRRWRTCRGTRSCGEAGAYSETPGRVGSADATSTESPGRRLLTGSDGAWCGAENPRFGFRAMRYVHACLGKKSVPTWPRPAHQRHHPRIVMESIRPALASIRISASRRAYRPLYQCLHTSAVRGATPLPHPSGTTPHS